LLDIIHHHSELLDQLLWKMVVELNDFSAWMITIDVTRLSQYNIEVSPERKQGDLLERPVA